MPAHWRDLAPNRTRFLGVDVLWFHHFHKAGGSSVVAAAQAAGWRPHRPHANGNPLGPDGRELPIWEMDAAALTAWLRARRRRGMNFVACEWGFSEAATALRRPRLFRAAVLRDPVERVISSFVFDRFLGEAETPDILDYLHDPRDFQRLDYYSNRVAGRSDEAGREAAFRTLMRFESLSFLGRPESYARLDRLIPGVAGFHENRGAALTGPGEAARARALENAALRRDRLEAMAEGERRLYRRLLEARGATG
ncbi:MAG: hypothetical protein AAF676_01940 [Pseudomonadota bacterium]